MKQVKNFCYNIFHFMKKNTLKAMLIKLGIALCLLFVTFYIPAFRWIILVLLSLYVACEFSAQSLVWVVLGSITLPYTNLVGKVAIYLILMGEMLAIYLIKLIKMFINKQIKIKNWRTISLLVLFGVFSLLLILPLAQTYSLGSQLSFWFLVAFLLTTLIFIKEINFKTFFKSFVLMVVGICVAFLIVSLLNPKYGIQILAHYSNGYVNRFTPVLGDPNMACGVMIIALMALFILYKQNELSKPVYFSLLAVLGIFILRTLSKSGIIVVAVLALYIILDVVITSIKIKQKKHLLELVWYGISVAIVCLMEWQFIDALFNRMTGNYEGWWNQEQEAKPLDNITTGRMTLWIEYFKGIFKSIQIVLFGSGIKSGFISRGAAHNIIIEYLYKLGLIQTILLFAMFVIAILPYLKHVKVHNFVPLILITLFYCSVGSTSSKYMSIFIISFMSITYNSFCIVSADDKECNIKTSKN